MVANFCSGWDLCPHPGEECIPEYEKKRLREKYEQESRAKVKRHLESLCFQVCIPEMYQPLVDAWRKKNMELPPTTYNNRSTPYSFEAHKLYMGEHGVRVR